MFLTSIITTSIIITTLFFPIKKEVVKQNVVFEESVRTLKYSQLQETSTGKRVNTRIDNIQELIEYVDENVNKNDFEVFYHFEEGGTYSEDFEGMQEVVDNLKPVGSQLIVKPHTRNKEVISETTLIGTFTRERYIDEPPLPEWKISENKNYNTRISIRVNYGQIRYRTASRILEYLLQGEIVTKENIKFNIR